MFLACKALELQNRRTFQNIVCDVAGALGKLRVCVDASTSTDCLQIFKIKLLSKWFYFGQVKLVNTWTANLWEKRWIGARVSCSLYVSCFL